MNGRKLTQMCIGSSGACNKRLGTRTYLWSSCWHAALLYSTILLDGELSSRTYAAWILQLQSFLLNATHSQRKLGRLPFIHVGVLRFYVGVPSDSRNFISLYLSWPWFRTRVLRGIWHATRFLLSSNDFLSTMDCMILPIFPWPTPLCFVSNVRLLVVVYCKLQWTALFKFTWSAADTFLTNAIWTSLTASSHNSWNNHSSLELYGGFSRLRGVGVGKRDIRAAIFIFYKLEGFNAQVVVFLPSFETKMLGHQVPSCVQKNFWSMSSKSTLFPQYFFFFPGKSICCVWSFSLAFVPKGNGFPLRNFVRLCEFSSPNNKKKNQCFSVSSSR